MTGTELYEVLWRAKRLQGGPTPVKGYATVAAALILDETVYKEDGLPLWTATGPKTKAVDLLPGATVKVVMVSRLGDFGLTSQLSRDYGYAVRVMPNDPRFINWRLLPEAEEETDDGTGDK